MVVVLVLFAAPAFAGEGCVSQGALSALGLGDMQVVSDAAGTQVRGMASSFGMVKGTSLIFGQLLTPDTKNFVIGSSVNEVDANAETTAAGGALTLTKAHDVTLSLDLSVLFPDGLSFAGMILGGAGGSGSVSAVQP
jgi:hypothetical protein